MKKKLLAAMFGAVLVLGACGGGDKEKEENGAATTPEETAPAETASADPEALVNQSCISCHGGNLDLEGGVGPALNQIGANLSEEEIHDVIINGQGSMPPKLLEGEDAEVVAKWLAEKK